MVGSGPFRLVEGTAGGSTYRFEANPDYWGGAPHIDEVVFRVFKSRRPRRPGADQGRGRLRREHSRGPGRRAQGQAGHHRPERRLTRLRGDRVQHRRRRHRDRQADRRRQPGAEGPGVPARARLRASTTTPILERSTRVPGTSGTTIIPPAYEDFHWAPTGDDAFTLRPREGRPAARRGRLQEGRRRTPHDAERRSRSARSGSSPGRSRRPRWTPWTSSRSGWATSGSRPR